MAIKIEQAKKGLRVRFTNRGCSAVVKEWSLDGQYGVLQGDVLAGTARVHIDSPGHDMYGRTTHVNLEAMDTLPESNEEACIFLKPILEWR